MNEKARQIRKFGTLRAEYLRDHKKGLYDRLILDGTLNDHLADIQEQANLMKERITEQLLMKDPAPDKRSNPMAWVQHINMIQAQAEEIILHDLIYAD
jgi:hypothetical protein